MDNNHHFPLQQFITNEGLKHLAEEIFRYLDVKSLAKCRLVCYSWKCVIDQNRHWWILHLKNLRKNPKLFVDVYMWKNHVIRQSRALFLDRFPTWTSTFDYFENEAKIQKLEEFVSLWSSEARPHSIEFELEYTVVENLEFLEAQYYSIYCCRKSRIFGGSVLQYILL